VRSIATALEVDLAELQEAADLQDSPAVAAAQWNMPIRTHAIAIALALMVLIGGFVAERSLRVATPAHDIGTATASPSIPSKPYAVLPLVNVNDDPDLEFFGERLFGKIHDSLAKFDIRALRKSSSLKFIGRHQDVREAGKELDVDRMLEWRVSKAGTKAHVAAQLVAVADGSVLWSAQYEREMSDLAVARKYVSESIAWGLVTEAGFTLTTIELMERIDEFVQLGIDVPVEFESVNLTHPGGLEATFVVSSNAQLMSFLEATADAGFPELVTRSFTQLPSVGPTAQQVTVNVERFKDRRVWRPGS
jgi:TolB-like protein|tara:strand:+ start:121 stop:1038 length:918 start_codon:yes stop_codon:yes gene_type:complete